MQIYKSQNKALILFGSTGDLSLSKILPSLYNLFLYKKLGSNTKIFCVGRKEFSNEEFHKYICEKAKLDKEKAQKDFLKKIVYVQGDPSTKDLYKKLKTTISEEFLSKSVNTYSYLAVPQELHQMIVKGLTGNVFDTKIKGRYVAVEKPFGTGSISARKLYTNLTRYLPANQLVLIDHYLYKEPIKDLIFKMNSGGYLKHVNIEKIHVMLEEKATVEHRLDFYDKVGALNDVGQNHVLQMLAVVLAGSNSSKKKVSEINNLTVSTKPIFETYKGYLGSKNTNTYFEAQFVSKTRRWANTEILISGGKGLNQNKSGIELQIGKAKKIFINANGKVSKNNDAYFNVMNDLLNNKPHSVDIDEIISSWKLCEKITSQK